MTSICFIIYNNIVAYGCYNIIKKREGFVISLESIREKNKNNNSFYDMKIEYNLPKDEVEEIKEEVFNKVVKPINLNVLKEE